MVNLAPDLCSDSLLVGDGLRLALDVHAGGSGEQVAPGLLFAHGFGQTRAAWAGAIAELGAAGHHCVSFDSRGHGQSDRLPGGDYQMDQFVDDLLRVARAQPSPPVLIGASMGGLLGLIVAAEATPPPFRALVLVDVTPRWEAAGVERIFGFMQARPEGFASYAEAADWIAHYLPQRSGRKSERQLKPLLREGVDGRLRWHWDPALFGGLVRDIELHQPRLLAAAAKVTVPILLLSGGRSDVVSTATVDEFLALAPHAEHRRVPQATHMLAGDANDAFTQAVAEFIDRLPPLAPGSARVVDHPSNRRNP